MTSIDVLGEGPLLCGSGKLSLNTFYYFFYILETKLLNQISMDIFVSCSPITYYSNTSAI